MSRFLALTFVMFATQASAQEAIGQPKPSAGKLIYENWMSASFDGVRAGYVYDSVIENDVGGVKILKASRRLALNIRRFGDPAVMEAVTGTDEMPDGKVVGTFMKQQISKNVVTVVRGVVEGDQLHTTAEGQMNFDKRIPWDPTVVGMWGELQIVSTKKPAPGTAFEYLIYEPTVNALVKVQAKVEATEWVVVMDKKYNLLRVTAQPQPIASIKLPGSTFWYDFNYNLIKTETLMPGMGRLVLERTSRADAMRPCQGPDLGTLQSIKLAQRLVAPHDAATITYRIKLTDEKPIEVFAKDDRQAVKVIEGGVELVIQASRQPSAVPNTSAVPPGAEFLESNYFLTSDHPLVKQHAAAAIGSETDPWKKSLLIERWVHQNMRALNFTDAMAPASEVARTLSGDCTEYSMLAAAMCRAAGVPSRTAIGWVYVDAREGRPPMLAMHMWTEVWVNGQWIGLDATIGRGHVGPAHIKITDHSWHKTATMTPLLPLMRLNMASPTVEIVSEQRVTK
jgi:Transglutaminase-like superfamily